MHTHIMQPSQQSEDKGEWSAGPFTTSCDNRQQYVLEWYYCNTGSPSLARSLAGIQTSRDTHVCNNTPLETNVTKQ